MLDTLKQYKELIAIMVFFLGGFIWIQNQFPTKTDLSDEVRSLRCLLNKYMLLTQEQIKGRDLERREQGLASQISLYDDDQDSTRLSPAMRQDLETKRQDLADVGAALKENLTLIQNIRDELGRAVCGVTL